MKTVRYTADALNDLRRLRAQAEPIMAKIARYAETGGGKVTTLVGRAGEKRIRIGDFRAIFEETADTVLVTKIDNRRDVYE